MHTLVRPGGAPAASQAHATAWLGCSTARLPLPGSHLLLLLLDCCQPCQLKYHVNNVLLGLLP